MADKNDLKIGEMPKPKYFGEESEKLIGIKAYSLEEDIKDYIWWNNNNMGDLIDKKSRHEAAAFIARLKLELNAESAIGPAIDLTKSDSKTDHVEIIENSEIYGVYIEEKNRPGFNFIVNMEGVKTEEELRQLKPIEFEEIFQKAKKVLPYPHKELPNVAQ